MIIQYKLKTNHWLDDIEARLIEINEIRSWLDELTARQPERYKITFHSSGQMLSVWFDCEKDATIFALRWL